MTEIAKIIMDLGIAAVSITVVIFILIKTQKNRADEAQRYQKMMEGQQQNSNEQVDRLYLMLAQINKHTDPIHSKEEEQENKRINLLINEQLSKLLQNNKANRVLFFSYHNGGKDVLGRSFQKMSITHECVDFNTVPAIKSYQNVPRMMFPVLIKELEDKGNYYIPDLEKIKEDDPTTFQFFYTRRAKAAMIQAVSSGDKMIVGFIVVEYSQILDEMDIQKLRRCTREKAFKISGALEMNMNLGGRTLQ